MQIQKSSMYYQATVERNLCWFVVAALKTYDHICFDRTIDIERSIFEFFVPQDMEQLFLHVMHYFEQKGLVTNLQKLPNRLINHI
ncbi:MAG TPA: hypothetical protein VGW78_06055 [Candidatus Babeliales bacterium]|jgi:hypothetical protein|nr:hypothetical protein [Candidatus Babeliales bacterium]